MAKSAGYSGTPLAAKLGIKAGSRVCLIGAPSEFRGLLDPLPNGVSFSGRLSGDTDIIHLFVRRRAELQTRLGAIRQAMRADAAIWISWPKKASGVVTDVTEDVIRGVALPLGLVDVKVCAIDDVWSGLKVMVRKELRGSRVRA